MQPAPQQQEDLFLDHSPAATNVADSYSTADCCRQHLSTYAYSHQSATTNGHAEPDRSTPRWTQTPSIFTTGHHDHTVSVYPTAEVTREYNSQKVHFLALFLVGHPDAPKTHTPKTSQAPAVQNGGKEKIEHLLTLSANKNLVFFPNDPSWYRTKTNTSYVFPRVSSTQCTAIHLICNLITKNNQMTPH